MTDTLQRRRGHLELQVVFDTSAIFTPSATDFFSYEVSKLIQESGSPSDLTIQWYVPEIVILERRYQLVYGAEELLRSVKKLEKFLMQPMGIRNDAIETRTDAIIQEALKKNRVQVIKLDTTKVDWQAIMLNAAYRRPPFEPGDTEKGFRDALVAECYMQLLDASPAEPQSCRVVLITKDNLLSKSINDRIAQRPNAHPPSTTEEVRGLINALISAVSEKFIARIRESASEFFFRPEAKDTLFVNEELQRKIEQQYRDKLLEVPEGAERRINEAWLIAPPQFLKKEGQRVTWISQISLQHSAFRTTYTPFAPGGSSFSGGSNLRGTASPSAIFPTAFTWGTVPVFGTGASPSASGGQIPLYPGQPAGSVGNYYTPQYFARDVLVATGRTIFEVEWSVEVTESEKLTDPKVEQIRLSQASWD